MKHGRVRQHVLPRSPNVSGHAPNSAACLAPRVAETRPLRSILTADGRDFGAALEPFAPELREKPEFGRKIKTARRPLGCVRETRR